MIKISDNWASWDARYKAEHIESVLDNKLNLISVGSDFNEDGDYNLEVVGDVLNINIPKFSYRLFATLVRKGIFTQEEFEYIIDYKDRFILVEE